MTRYKKYLQKKGYKLENDFPYIPYDFGGEYINITPPVLDGVTTWINEELRCINICYHYVVGNSLERIYTDGHIETVFD